MSEIPRNYPKEVSFEAVENTEEHDPVKAMMYWHERAMTSERELAAKAEECEKLRKDAERWRHARRYLDATDIVAWDDWDGHVPDESLSIMADAAIDAAREGK